MDKRCKNCEYTLTDKFCAHCGQEEIQNPIKYWDFINVFLSNAYLAEKKFYYTVKKLFIPGFLCNEFLAGRRVPYKHPMILFYSLLAISIIVNVNLYEPVQKSFVEKTETEKTILSAKKNKEEATNLKLDYLLTIPLISLFIFLLYGRTLVVFEKGIIFAINWSSMAILIDTALFILVYLLHFILNRQSLAITDQAGSIMALAYTITYLVLGLKSIFNTSFKQAALKSLVILGGITMMLVLILMGIYWILKV